MGVIGVFTKRKCTARCHNAKSKSCRCSCGGENHGAARRGQEIKDVQPGIFQPISAEGFETTRGAFYGEDATGQLGTEYVRIGKIRARSGEVDFGVWWRDGKQYPTYRVSWVEATGELYAEEQPGYPTNEMARIIVFGKAEGRENIERVMKGWAEICGAIDSLNWVRSRFSN